MVMMMLKNAV